MKLYTTKTMPSMAEINKMRKTHIAVSTFSGMGGSSIGLKLAGFDVRYASEFVPIAFEHYKNNCGKSTYVDNKDIREVTAKRILRLARIESGELDLLEGSPPCFVAGTKILTDRGYVNIEEIQVRDMVMTHARRFQPVTTLMSRSYAGELYTVTCSDGTTVTATPEHPFYCVDDSGDKVWVEAQQLQIGQRIFKGDVFRPVHEPYTTARVFVVVKTIDKHHPKIFTTVYNLSVKEDETYTANGLVVHNCKLHSTASKEKLGGKRRDAVVKYEGKIHQRLDDLFDQYIRLLRKLQPKTFIAENVVGMTMGDSKQQFLDSLSDMRASGYQVEARIIDASRLGVAQKRQRVIFVGVRNDLNMKPVFPKPLAKETTVGEVLPHIVKIRSADKMLLAINHPSPTILSADHIARLTARMSCGGWCEDDKGVIRKYTIDEFKVLSSVPPDFKMSGKFTDQWARLGRLFVPLMAYYVAATIKEQILMKLPE